jgi:prophage regulatory protein
MRLLCFNQLKEVKGVAYTREHLARLVKASKFPQPVPLSGKRIAWLDSEIDDWIAARAADRIQKPAA